MKIICKYEISSESVITPKEAILYIDGNLSEKNSKNETENMKRATYLKVEKAPTKRYDEYYKDGKQITSQDLMANNKTAPKQTRSCYSHCMVWERLAIELLYRQNILFWYHFCFQKEDCYGLLQFLSNHSTSLYILQFHLSVYCKAGMRLHQLKLN